MSRPAELPSAEGKAIYYVSGIDIGSQSCLGCICRADKRVVVKPMEFANTKAGWKVFVGKLEQLGVPPSTILVGMEATARYGENLYHELEQRGYALCLLHPGQTHQYHQQQGLRAKTDRLDAMTIARLLLSGEARPGYIPSDQVATYRELVRLHSHLSDEGARYKNEIHALVIAVFPEFYNVFADPCRQSALALLKRYPSAQAIRDAGVEQLTTLLREVAPRHYGRPTAERLVEEARRTGSSGRAAGARSTSLRIMCEQLEQIQKNLAQLEKELDSLMEHDSGVTGLKSIPEFGPKTVAVLRAELGEVDRFARTDQVIAYGGLDIEIKESGFWKGKAKLSKRGSGHLRRVLYLAAVRSVRLEGSAFGAYYHRLVARGMKKGSALVAVMRKMLAVAAHVMKSGERYDPTKVCASSAGSLAGQ